MKNKYKNIIPEKILDWFDDNYLEPKDECAEAIIEGVKKSPFTIEQLKEGCEFLKKTELDSKCIWVHIKIISDLSRVGISATLAGEKIREILINIHK